VWTKGLSRAFVVVLSTVVILVGLMVTWDRLSQKVHRVQARQVWALVVFAAGGDPVELSRWVLRENCEQKRQEAGRDYYERGVAVGLKCQGLKSWWELLWARDRAPIRLDDLK
jgi:hypothetical protein